MTTAEELLSGEAGVDNTLIISNDLRTITIPPTVRILGVESDDEVLRLSFKMSRYIGDVDLSEFSIRVNYLNAQGKSDAYTVSDAAVDEDNITFTWLVGPTATRYKGDTKFNVCLVLLDADGYVDKEFNTTPASLKVLEGLEVDESIVEEYSDILEQWRRELFDGGNRDANAVTYTPQNKTEEEKAQARENIGAVSIEDLQNITAQYNTIEDALAGTNITQDGKVVTHIVGDVIDIILLDDVSSSTTINITKDCTLHLNGKTLSFTAMGAKLNITTASEVTINGKVSGSEITKNITNTDGNTERLVSVTNTKLSITGGTYSMYGTYSKMAIAIATENTSTDCEMTDCTVIVDASATNVRCAQVQGATIIDNCSLTAINQTGDVVGVTTSSSTESITIKNTKAIGKSYGMGSSVRVFNPQAKATTIENCHVEADGYSDCDTDGDGVVNIVNVYAIYTPKPITINGGYYWGARDAIAVGIACINGGVFEGCQHGGAYMMGSDIKVKNAIFRNVEYRGNVGWLEGRNHGGAFYCGSSENDDVNVYLDNCRFESNCLATSGIVAKETGTEVFLSNCVIDGDFINDLRADATCTIYVGKNVAYKTVLENGTIDTTTYAGQEFSFETEPTNCENLINIKTSLLQEQLDSAVLFTPQTLTKEQQAQARENIGASGIYLGSGNMPDGYSIQIDPDGEPFDLRAVTYTPQTLTPKQQAQARKNIGAAEVYAETQDKYFDITDDGIISLKPEYRGAIPSTKYPYAISDNGQGVAGSKNSELPEVIVIPEVVNEIAVTAFQIGVFAYNTAVKSITIPNFITEIPQIFARDAINLHTISGTENVKVLGTQAFYKTSIQKANFPSLGELVGSSHFQYCTNLISANIGNKITAISPKMFAFCEKLSSVYNDANVTSVGESAFTRTKRLKNLSFLPNLTQIGANGFRYSRINYDWASLGLQNDAFGTNATVLQYNPTDFWSACNHTTCNNLMRSTFTQHDPRWADDAICNVSGLTWDGDGCNPTSAAMIYSVFENKDLASPKEFVDAVKAVNPSLMDLNPRNSLNIKQWLEAVGYTVEEKVYSAATLQEMYDALATGALVLSSVDNNSVDYFGDGHAAVFYGVNANGEILVQDPMTDGKIIENHAPAPYAMPIQNLSAMGSGFLIVTKN